MTVQSAAALSVSQNYYPIAQNSQWTFDSTDSTVQGSFFETISIRGTKTVSGLPAIVFNDDNANGTGVSREDYYSKDSRAFTSVGNNDRSDWLSAAIGPFDEMRFDGTFASAALFDKQGISIADLDGDGINESLDVRGVGVVEGFETVTTTAGSFSSTARIRYDVNGTIRLSKDVSIGISQTATLWRAPEIGLIKQVVSGKVGTVSTLATMNIRGYVVNGSAAGYLEPKTMIANVAPASSDYSQPGRHAVSSNGNEFFIVAPQQTGTQFGSPTNKWLGQIVAADGTAQRSFDLSPAFTAWDGEAAVAFDGTNYLVLTDTRARLDGVPQPPGLTAQRISAAGTVVDTYPGAVLATGGINPAVSFGSGTYLAVYAKNVQPSAIYGRLISPGGALGSEFVISAGTGNLRYPAVAFDGSNFLVAWQSTPAGSGESLLDIYAARVSPAGAVLDQVPIAVATASEAQTYPHISCDGTNCLVIWVDRRNYPGQTYSVLPGPGDVYGSFISSAGTLMNGPASSGGIPIATNISANAGFPGVVFTGTEYLIAWSHGEFVNNPGGPTGIYAARMSTTGNVSAKAGTGDTVSGPPAPSVRFRYLTVTKGANGTLVTWLNNSETTATQKSVNGALVFPIVAR